MSSLASGVIPRPASAMEKQSAVSPAARCALSDAPSFSTLTLLLHRSAPKKKAAAPSKSTALWDKHRQLIRAEGARLYAENASANPFMEVRIVGCLP